MGNFVKEVFIFALLFMVIMFTLGILLYDYIPTSKSIPEPIEYTADSSVTATLQEIAEVKNAGSSSNINTAVEPEWSYSVTSSDLATYASKKSYTSGKTDPFAEYIEETTENEETSTDNTTTTTNTTTSSTNSSSSTTGTYFESSSSK